MAAAGIYSADELAGLVHFLEIFHEDGLHFCLETGCGALKMDDDKLRPGGLVSGRYGLRRLLKSPEVRRKERRFFGRGEPAPDVPFGPGYDPIGREPGQLSRMFPGSLNPGGDFCGESLDLVSAASFSLDTDEEVPFGQVGLGFSQPVNGIDLRRRDFAAVPFDGKHSEGVRGRGHAVDFERDRLLIRPARASIPVISEDRKLLEAVLKEDLRAAVDIAEKAVFFVEPRPAVLTPAVKRPPGDVEGCLSDRIPGTPERNH